MGRGTEEERSLFASEVCKCSVVMKLCVAFRYAQLPLPKGRRETTPLRHLPHGGTRHCPLRGRAKHQLPGSVPAIDASPACCGALQHLARPGVASETSICGARHRKLTFQRLGAELWSAVTAAYSFRQRAAPSGFLPGGVFSLIQSHPHPIYATATGSGALLI